MKSFEEIINQNPVYLHSWKEELDVIGDFENIYMTGDEYRMEESPYVNVEFFNQNKSQMTEAIKRYKTINILFASYGTDNYSGDAWVLFEQNGKLYEVNGSHCSCFGLEGQWDAEEVCLKELENRFTNGSFGECDGYGAGNEFKNAAKEFLGIS